MEKNVDLINIFDKQSRIIGEQSDIIYQLIELLAQHISVDEVSQIQFEINTHLCDLIDDNN